MRQGGGGGERRGWREDERKGDLSPASSPEFSSPALLSLRCSGGQGGRLAGRRGRRFREAVWEAGEAGREAGKQAGRQARRLMSEKDSGGIQIPVLFYLTPALQTLMTHINTHTNSVFSIAAPCVTKQPSQTACISAKQPQ